MSLKYSKFSPSDVERWQNCPGAKKLNNELSEIAIERGLVEGVDFVREHDWPQGLSDLRWTGDGWQRRTDPRYFPCCERDHD